MMWTLSEAVAYAGGSLQGPDTAFEGVVTDSRASCAGQLFVALRGERFDGHDHVAAAARAGAVAALVERPLPVELPQWIVPDTRLGLGRLAAAWRDRFRGRVVAVTGSNGKTTVKEMLAAILGQVGRVRATAGNLNNDIGLPLTLLAARDEDWLVLEMGANHAGEIAGLTGIARPEAALITNAGRAHLEGFGSVEGVARAKGEIALGLPPDGLFVVPGDAPWLDLWRELAAGRRLLTFALDAPADLSAATAGIRAAWDDAGFRTVFAARQGERELPLALSLAGFHNVRNALAAASLALGLGLPPEAVRAGLLGLKPVRGRLVPRRCGRAPIGTVAGTAAGAVAGTAAGAVAGTAAGAVAGTAAGAVAGTAAGAAAGEMAADGAAARGPLRVIDDTYNANPDSLAAAIAVLAALPGPRWLVLGDLGELGAEAAELHAEVGAGARAAGIDRLFSVGVLSADASRAFGAGGRHFEDQARMIAALRAELDANAVVLVKGSRLARMEQVVEALCAGEID